MARLIRIVCVLPGFRRAGISHPHRAEYPEGFFSDAQLLQLRAEPKLSVYEVEPIPDPLDARGGGRVQLQSALTDGVAVLSAAALNATQGEIAGGTTPAPESGSEAATAGPSDGRTGSEAEGPATASPPAEGASDAPPVSPEEAAAAAAAQAEADGAARVAAEAAAAQAGDRRRGKARG